MPLAVAITQPHCFTTVQVMLATCLKHGVYDLLFNIIFIQEKLGGILITLLLLGDA